MLTSLEPLFVVFFVHCVFLPLLSLPQLCADTKSRTMKVLAVITAWSKNPAAMLLTQRIPIACRIS
jgi:hypothetical protein